jgi:hypothetical protein
MINVNINKDVNDHRSPIVLIVNFSCMSIDLSSIDVDRVSLLFMFILFPSCIVHLNQHHNAIHRLACRTLTDVKNYRLLLEEKIDIYKQQQIAWNRFFDNEITYLTDRKQTIDDICRHLSTTDSTYASTLDYRQHVDKYESIKHNIDDRTFLQTLLNEIEYILHEQYSRRSKSITNNRYLLFT